MRFTPRTSRLLAPAMAVFAAAVLVSCDDPTTPPTTGSIEPRIALIQADSQTRAQLVLPLTAVRARSIGPTGRTIDLDPVGSVWRGSLTGLAAGTYEVIIEGIANGQVQYYGRLTNINVGRGQRAQPTIPFAAAIPTVNIPPLNNTTAFAQRIPFRSVTGASSYIIQVSQDSTFLGAVEVASPDTQPIVTVNAHGRWHIRAKAVLPGIEGTSVPYADSRGWNIVTATGGDTEGAAQALTLVPQTPLTTTQRNLTSTKREDWFEFDLRDGDTLSVETFANRLTIPSPLNTTLTLYRDNGTEVASSGDISGSTDSRILHTATNTETYRLRVSAPAGSNGHFELVTGIRRLPRSPSGLVATVMSGTAVDLAWNDDADNETGYRIERCTGAGCSDFTEIGTAAANAEAFSVTGLTQGSTYRFRVMAVNAVGTSLNAPIAAAELVGPAAPTGLTATAISATRIDLAWVDASTNETGFEIARCSGAACTDPVVIATVPAGTQAYSDLTVTFGNAYRYSVRATNNVVPSTYAGPADANTIPPATPSALVATTTGPSRIALSWTDNSTTEAGFRIERCTGDACNTFAEIGTVGLNVQAFVDSLVSNNQAYRYRVRAFNAVNGADYTNIADANTRPPAAPTALTATTQGPTTIRITWTDNSLIETGTRVERCAGLGCSDFADVTLVAADSTGFTDNTVAVDTWYLYRVSAVGVAGISATSNVAQANTLRPAAPTSLTATTLSANVIRIVWVDNADNETGYTLSRCATPGCTNFTTLATFAAPRVTYDDSTTVAGVTYVYQLRATNIAGASAASNNATANTLPPAAPSNLLANTASATRVDLSWLNNAPEATGTRVERCFGPGCTGFVEIGFVPAPGTSWVDTAGVIAGQVIRYRLRAQNVADVSLYTDVEEASTEVPATPGTLTYTIQGPTSVSLAWGASAGPNLLQYVVKRCEGVGCTPTTVLTATGAGTTGFVDNSVSLGTTYRYSIAASGVTGESAPGNVVNVPVSVPAPPTGVAVTLTVGGVQLAWTDPDGASEVIIDRCEGDPCGPSIILAVVPAGTQVYVDNAVSANQSYGYRFRGNNSIGFGAATSFTPVFPFFATAPSGLTGNLVSSTRIDVTWSDNALNETGYEIERCEGDGCSNFAPVDTVGANQTLFMDMSVQPGNSYTYRVRATAAFGSSAPTNQVTVTTRLPASPSGLVAQTLSNSSVRLTWTDNSDNESQFSVQLCEGVGCAVGPGNFIATPVNATEVVVNGLNPNTSYTFHVFATNVVGNSPPSNTATATTDLPAVPGPISVIVQGDGVSMQLQWTLVANATGYAIERCEGAGCTSFGEIIEVPEDGGTNTYIDAGLTGGTTYRYRIAARNAAGNSDYTEIIERTAGPPATPTGLAAILRPGVYAALPFTDASNNESGFELERCIGVGCMDFTYYQSVGANADSTIDVAIAVGNHYRYRLRALNLAGASAFTAPVDLPVFLPEAPSGLTATTFSATQVNLAWTDNGPNETGFEIQRCQGASCSNFATIDTTAADAVAFSDVGLAQNQIFRYRIRSLNAIGQSAFTAISEAATDLPVAPDSLVAVAMASDEIALTWADLSNNETQFLIEYCEGVGCTNFTFLALLAANFENYTHSGLVSGESYSYRIQAVGSAGSSPFSAVATTDTDSPTVVTGLTAVTQGPTRIDVSWTDNSTNELRYIVERCSDACGAFAAIDTLPPNANAFVDSTVVVDVSYQYRITASNNVGNVTSGTVLANTLRPAAPTAFSATTVSAAQVDLTWTDASANETQFIIERCTGAGCASFGALATVGADVTAYQDVTVAASESYTYRIRAANIAGESADAGPVTATTLVPAAPTGVTAVAVSPSQIDLSWTDAADNELGYRIERCTGASCSNYVEVGSVGPGVTSFPSTGLVASTFYRHRIRAFNNAGTSAFASPATDPTGIFAPTASTGLTATTLAATETRLTWTDVATNEAGFEVLRCAGDGCTPTTVVDTVPATVPSGATIYIDATAPAGVIVRYRVRVFNGVGVGGNSNTAQTSTTVPNAPTNFSATANGQSQAQMSWLDQSGDETGFVVERCGGEGCTDFVPLDTVAAGVTSFDDNSVTGGNVYRYRVYAIGNGRSAFSGVERVSTILPPAATALVATPLSNDLVSLTWQDNATDETGYIIERCVGAGCSSFVVLFIADSNTTTYEDTSAPVGQALTYRVLALNPAGSAAPSNEASVATTIPALPNTLVGTLVSATQIDLSWVNPATDEDGIIIERCEGVGCTNFVAIDTAAVDETTYQDASALAGVVYRYRVRSYNANGTSGATAVVTLSTTVPDAPTGLALNLPQTNAGAVGLTWTDVSTTETGYIVERCDGTGCSSFSTIATLGAGSTGYNDGPITLDTTYLYRVRAENVVGLSLGAILEVRTYRPAIATGLTATTISGTRIDLAWSVPDSGVSSGTTVERCTGAGCSTFFLDDVIANDGSSYSDTGLNPGLVYRYRILRENIFGTLGESAVAEASTDIPLSPSGVTVTTLGPTTLQVDWTDNSMIETGFFIERCDSDPCTGAWVTLDTLGANAGSYFDTTATIGAAYSYRVSAFSAAGTSAPSAVGAGNTFLPEAVTLSAATITSSSTVDLEWATAAYATSYVVERCELPGCSYVAIDTVAAPTVTLTDGTVALGTAYQYRVRGLNVVGDGIAANDLGANINPPATPGVPTIVALSPTSAQLTWVDASDNETRFIIERCEGAGCGDFATVDSVGAGVTTYQDPGLTYGGKYEYQIIAVNAIGASAPTAPVLIVMQEPGIPQSLTALTTGPGQITVQWLDNSDNETRFLLERCAGVACVDFVQVQSLASGTTQFVDNGLSLNAAYRYRVRAINGVGPSDFSNIGAANTFLPAAATGLTATIINGARVDLAWVDNSLNEQGFRIERCELPSCAVYTEIAQVGQNVTSYSNTGLTYGQGFAYRVRAANISGDAPPTNTATAQLILAPPSDVRARVVNRDSVQLTWTYTPSWNSGFQVVRCVGAACSPVNGVGGVPSGVLSFIDEVPVAGIEYTYSVRAVTINGGSTIGNTSPARMPIMLSNATPVSGLADVFRGERHYMFSVPAGALGLRVRMDAPSGDADLYVKYNATGQFGQTLNDAQNCVPYTGNTPEICTFDAPAAGDWYAMVHGFQAYNNVTLKASLAQRFGVTNATGAGMFGIPANYIVAQKVVITDSVSVTHLGLRVLSVIGPANIRFGLYTARLAPDEPEALLTSWVGSATGAGLIEQTVPEVAIPPGTYWLAVMPDVTVDFEVDNTKPVESWPFVPGTILYSSGLPATWPSSGPPAAFAPPMNFWIRGFR